MVRLDHDACFSNLGIYVLRMLHSKRDNVTAKNKSLGAGRWMLCDTAGVGEGYITFSTGSPFGHHLRLSMVCPRWGQWAARYGNIRKSV